MSILDKLMNSWSVPEKLINKPFVSSKELITILNISLRTLYRLVNARRLPFFKVGNSLRFLREDIIAFLKSNRTDQLL
jgi:excisionase family DNA binding protein